MSLRKEDLKVGEVYLFKYSAVSFINKIKDLTSCKCFSLDTDEKKYRDLDYFGDSAEITLATDEEKQWLNKCIELNKYIPKEEALKPIEMTKEQLLEKAIRDYPVGTVVDQRTAYGGLGSVHKITGHTPTYMSADSFSIGGIGLYSPKRKLWAEIISKPVVETTKVDEFVIPEKWYMEVTKTNLPYINKARKLYGTIKSDLHPSYIYIASDEFNKITGATDGFDHSSFTQITFDQFKKYILKEDIEIKPTYIIPIKENNSVYTLKQIEAALSIFDKEDRKDILNAIKNHK
jgi:hypothetical protein